MRINRGRSRSLKREEWSGAVLVAALGLGLAYSVCASSATNGSWATVAGYYLGMPKEAAKKVGLADCKASLGTVECKVKAAKMGDATSTSSIGELNEQTGRLEKLAFQFPGTSYKAVAVAMVAQLGEPTAKDGDFVADDWRRGGHGSCTPVLVWHRGGDEVVAVCGPAVFGRGSPTYLVADRVAGRGKRWAGTEATSAASRRSADSFNSK